MSKRGRRPTLPRNRAMSSSAIHSTPLFAQQAIHVYKRLQAFISLHSTYETVDGAWLAPMTAQSVGLHHYSHWKKVTFSPRTHAPWSLQDTCLWNDPLSGEKVNGSVRAYNGCSFSLSCLDAPHECNNYIRADATVHFIHTYLPVKTLQQKYNIAVGCLETSHAYERYHERVTPVQHTTIYWAPDMVY